MNILKANHVSGSDPSVAQLIKRPSSVPSVPGSNPAAAATVSSAFLLLALRESFKTFLSSPFRAPAGPQPC